MQHWEFSTLHYSNGNVMNQLRQLTLQLTSDKIDAKVNYRQFWSNFFSIFLKRQKSS